MSIKTNTTDLQALLEVANNLPVAENLDTELSTQDDLIAQLSNALESKASVSYPTLSNPGTAEDLMSGKQLIDGDGNVVTGILVASVGSVSFNDVNFRDYDGTILYSYTKDEALALTAMPDLPTQEGLTCQGWNWSFENMQSYVNKYGKCEIGATYITDDGKTRIYITLQEGRTSPMLGVCPNGTVTVDWGDGTTPDTLTGTSISTVIWTPTHNYASAGDYVIALTVDGEMMFGGTSPNPNGGSGILRYSSSADYRNTVYRDAVKQIKIGNNVIGIWKYGLRLLYGLEKISIPNNVTTISQYAIEDSLLLNSIVVPRSVKTIQANAFQYGSKLHYVSLPDQLETIEFYALASTGIKALLIPDSVTSLGTYTCYRNSSVKNIIIPEHETEIKSSMFYYCISLRDIFIPSLVTSIGDSAFYECTSLGSISIPANVTNIYSKAFYNCYGLGKIRFNSTTPPTVANSNAFTGIQTDCIISVPTGTLSAYTSATNYPSADTYTYIEED